MEKHTITLGDAMKQLDYHETLAKSYLEGGCPGKSKFHANRAKEFRNIMENMRRASMKKTNKSNHKLNFNNRAETFDKLSAVRCLRDGRQDDEVQKFMNFMLLFHGKELTRRQAEKMMGKGA